MDSSTAAAAAATATPPSDRSKPHLRSNGPLDDDPIDHHRRSLILAPPSRKKSPISPSSPLHNSSAIPLQELLVLSHSPLRRPKPRSNAEEAFDPAAAAATPRRKDKRRATAAAGLMGCVSPRNVRRARRRLEKEIVREEREPGPLEDDAGRARKRKQSRPKVAQKEKMSLEAPIPSSSPLPRGEEITDGVGCSSVDGLRELIFELLMWKNVAKSTLWFGLGSIFFLSTSFSREFSFSIISTASHLGILILALAFVYDSFPQRQQLKWRGGFHLTEEDIVHAARVVLPVVNAALAKTQEIFSGEPSMTLKVAPILLFTAKYGHLITMWRFMATGFFLSFTAPKLYTSYYLQIHNRVESMRNYVCETWKSCRHKRFIAASAATVFWNLFSVKTRIFAAFISVAILRYRQQQQHTGEDSEEKEQVDCMEEDEEEQQQQQVMVVDD